MIWGKFEADWQSNGAIYLPFDQAELWVIVIRKLPIVNNSALTILPMNSQNSAMQNVGKIIEK